MSTFYMPPRGAPGAPVFDPDNVRSLLGFFDDLEYCFVAAGVQDNSEKKRHAVRYAPDSEKTIWRAFPEFATAGGDYDAFKKAILKDYIGGSLFSIHDLTSLVEATAKTSITSIKAFSEYSRKFRDIAASLVSNGYLRDHERKHLFVHGVEDSLRQEVVRRLRITHPAVLYPRQQYSIEQVTAAAHHVLDSVIPVAGTPFVHQQSELIDITQALKAATTAFAQLQQQVPLALGYATQQLPTTTPTPPGVQQLFHQPVSHVSASPTLTVPTRPAATHPRPPELAPSYSSFVPSFDYEERLAEMQRQLAAFKSQRAAQRIAQPPADHQATSVSMRSEPDEDYPTTASKPAAQYSRFKLPTVNITTTSATSAAKIELSAPSPSTATSSTVQERVVSFDVPPELPHADIRNMPTSSPQDCVSRALPSRSLITTKQPAATTIIPPPVYHPSVPIPSPPSSRSVPQLHPQYMPTILVPCPVYHHSTPVSSPPQSRSSFLSSAPPSQPSSVSLPPLPAPPSQNPRSIATHPTLVSRSPSDVPTPSLPTPNPPASPPSPPSPDPHNNVNANLSLSPAVSHPPSSSRFAVSPVSSNPRPVSILPANTIQIFDNLRRLDSFDFLFSFIRPPSLAHDTFTLSHWHATGLAHFSSLDIRLSRLAVPTAPGQLHIGLARRLNILQQGRDIVHQYHSCSPPCVTSRASPHLVVSPVSRPPRPLPSPVALPVSHSSPPACPLSASRSCVYPSKRPQARELKQVHHSATTRDRYDVPRAQLIRTRNTADAKSSHRVSRPLSLVLRPFATRRSRPHVRTHVEIQVRRRYAPHQHHSPLPFATSKPITCPRPPRFRVCPAWHVRFACTRSTITPLPFATPCLPLPLASTMPHLRLRVPTTSTSLAPLSHVLRFRPICAARAYTTTLPRRVWTEDGPDLSEEEMMGVVHG